MLHLPKLILSKASRKLRQDKDRVILIVDKGNFMVFLGGQDHSNKAMGLLVQRDKYRSLTADLTSKHKNKLINMLRNMKAERGWGDITYKRFYPTGEGSQNSLDYPRSTKGHPT